MDSIWNAYVTCQEHTENECDGDRSAKEYAIRDQIVIVTTNGNICEKLWLNPWLEKLRKSYDWNLANLCQKGMKYESAAAGEEETSVFEVNKVGAYSYQRIRNE